MRRITWAKAVGFSLLGLGVAHSGAVLVLTQNLSGSWAFFGICGGLIYVGNEDVNGWVDVECFVGEKQGRGI